MARIIFIMDVEEGHVLPSIALAQSLKRRGHSIVYLSVIDNRECLVKEGFEFHPIFEDIYPAGYRYDYKRANDKSVPRSEEKNHLDALCKGSYDSLIEQLAGDLYIVSFFLRLDILILYYKLNISPIIFTPFLRDYSHTKATECLNYLLKLPDEELKRLFDHFGGMGISVTSISEFTRPYDHFLELVACPRELDTSSTLPEKNTFNIGPLIRSSPGSKSENSIDQKDLNKRLIYASLGSQAFSYPSESKLFFSTIINVMRSIDLRDFHLILSTGPEFEFSENEGCPKNVTVKKWIPQIDILKRASLAITHGGLGTIKECIYYGVPMLVIPLDRDQPSNAKRIQFHKLGLVCGIGDLTASTLTSYILSIVYNDEILNNVTRMKEIFQKKEQDELGERIIEDVLNRKA